MTPLVWMFIKTYEPLRQFIIKNKSITTLIQMEYSAFEEATVPICAFVLGNSVSSKRGQYIRLTSFKGGMDIQREKVLAALNANQCSYFYEENEQRFLNIPGSPIAYWASDQIINLFVKALCLDDYAKPRQGLITGDNNRFLRLWFEVSWLKLTIGEHTVSKWVPLNKGGAFRRWYGNQEYVVNWEKDGDEIINFKDQRGKQKSRPQNLAYNFRESVSWSLITSGEFAARYYSDDFIFNVAGMSCFPTEHLAYILGLLNSKVVSLITDILNPTLNMNAGDIGKVPLVFLEEKEDEIKSLVLSNLSISKGDWDSFETSWDFQGHPLVRPVATIAEAFRQWQDECEDRFTQLKANEEELNRIFIDIYGLEDELSPEVDDKDVTVARVYDTPKDIPDTMKGNQYVRTKEDDIKSFISYAVGCMFGRFSLDWDGLAYAGGDWDGSKYQTIIPDPDNCMIITDEAYFEDDIVARFIGFVRVIYGSDTLEENLDFIADALGRKGSSSREIIRRYFLKDFYKDHVKTYQKRPIYWLFDSGRQEGFKALIYIHRWNADVIGNVRVNYLHRVQRVYDNELERLDDIVANSEHNRDQRQAEKKKSRLIKQIKEIRDYDEKIAYLANERIDIDLDDGVKVNHAKVQISVEGKNMKILANI